MTSSLRDLKRRRATEDLVRAAVELFATQGYEHTTVADIAAAATQSRSTFFRYFASKEDVLLSDHPRRLAELRGMLRGPAAYLAARRRAA